MEGTMRTGAPLLGTYDYALVALSIFIAISVSYVALDLGGRVTAARSWLRLAWLAGGAAAMGTGIWSMHFTGMLAYNLPVPVAYHWPTVLLSLLTAVLGSAIALYVVSRQEMSPLQAVIGSVAMGLAIAGMHLHWDGCHAPPCGLSLQSAARHHLRIDRGHCLLRRANVHLRLSRKFPRDHRGEGHERRGDGCCHISDALHRYDFGQLHSLRSAPEYNARREHSLARLAGNRCRHTRGSRGRDSDLVGGSAIRYSGPRIAIERTLPSDRGYFAGCPFAQQCRLKRGSVRQSCLRGDLGSHSSEPVRRPALVVGRRASG